MKNRIAAKPEGTNSSKNFAYGGASGKKNGREAPKIAGSGEVRCNE